MVVRVEDNFVRSTLRTVMAGVRLYFAPILWLARLVQRRAPRQTRREQDKSLKCELAARALLSLTTAIVLAMFATTMTQPEKESFYMIMIGIAWLGMLTANILLFLGRSPDSSKGLRWMGVFLLAVTTCILLSIARLVG